MRMLAWALVALLVAGVAFVIVPWIVATVADLRQKGGRS